MTTVRVAERKIQVDDTAIPLISGEVHYWRLSPNAWRDIITRVKDMGLTVVATYVCWDFHEIAPRTYDFTGETDPRRNLLGFLDLLTEAGLWIILRPGPYIYSEWRNNGVPDHAAQYHRLAPEFQDVAEHYMAAVVDAVRPYLATNGGRIIVWQSDNELDPWPHLYTEQLGLGRARGPFHDFLAERYGDVTALNTAWRTHYDTIDEARAIMEMHTNDARLMARYNDLRSFYHWYVHQVAAWGIDVYKRHGVDLPILLNTYSGVAVQHWSNLEQIADIVGPDIYPSREFRNRGGNKEHRTVIEASRYTAAYSRLPYIPEYESGIWHDWLGDVGHLPANHYRLICVSAMLGGVAGWNWYMLVNRDNWYQSPINEWGRTRPELYNTFCEITGAFLASDPTTLNRLNPIAVTFDPLQRGTERPAQDLLQSLYTADIDYDFMDLSQPLTGHRVAFYAGGHWLPRASQDRLADFVNGGGHLICIGDYPRLDEHHHPYNALNIAEPDGIVSTAPFSALWAMNGARVPSPYVYDYSAVSGQAIKAVRLPVENISSEELQLQFDLEAGAEYTIGYTIEQGAGRITVIGIAPTPAILQAVLQNLHITLPSQSQTADISTALYERDGDYYLMVTNSGYEAKTARITLNPALVDGAAWHAKNLLGGASPDVHDNQVTVNIGASDGLIIQLMR